MTNIELSKIPDFSKSFSYYVPHQDIISCCYLRFFSPPQIPQNQDNFLSLFKPSEIKPQIILLTAVPENMGESLSNSIEFAIPQVFKALETEVDFFDPKNCIFIENYNQDTYPSYPDHEEDFETFHLVKICRKLILPVWESISADDLTALIQGKFEPKRKRFFKSFVTRRWNPYLIFTPGEVREELKVT